MCLYWGGRRVLACGKCDKRGERKMGREGRSTDLMVER